MEVKTKIKKGKTRISKKEKTQSFSFSVYLSLRRRPDRTRLNRMIRKPDLVTIQNASGSLLPNSQ